MVPCDIVPPVSLQNIDLLISLPLSLGAMVCMNIKAQYVPMFYFYSVNRPPTCELRLKVIVIMAPPIEDRRALVPSCIAEGHFCFASFFCFRSFGAVLSTPGRTLGKNEQLKLLSDFTLKLLDDPWVWSGVDNCATTTINVS